ncbi:MULTISPECIES: penicillin-binding protein 2 [unclassified Massilia]|uniref:peptidoglycan D,D-transpeptidase FtsI family protein n=1 Tax=unclassified Massilia TaxID=2609279 RepID=UPI00177AFA6D|nr:MULTISPECIES: penicillin-binding protein 2 [unclassified Massilia]MBD8529180.1 penicillin-binding protein 2 [Massilia sp. CFBP 13647]MBD8672574.1 penicillin-binding protein 2 [Massilia sp. CFBP 13721]
MKRDKPFTTGRVAAAKGMAFSKSPVLAVRLPDWRSRVMLFVLFAAFAALGLRALWLQGMSTQFLQKQGKSRYERTLELPATRGKIMDRNGQVLASSLPVKAVWAIPEDVLASPPEKLTALAGLLEMPEAELRKKLDSDRTFVYLKRQVEMDVIARIEKLKITGLDTRKEYKRFYPQGEVMTHMVGFTNVEDVGQEGMELAQQKSLVGAPGSRRVIKDRLGRIVEDLGYSREPHDGKDLTLSVDSKLQYIAFTSVKNAVEKFNAQAGGAVVLDVQTGEVLAMANYPSYNPNDRRNLTGAQLRNRVITDTFEPGSTIKPVTVALGLETKRITPNTVFDTSPGFMMVTGKRIRDTHNYGVRTVGGIIQKSSNIGVVKISQMIPAQEMWEMYTKLGYGQAPRFGFPGPTAGRVRPWKSWKPIEYANMAFGHGLSVSLLQMARSYMIFARNGDIIPLSFVKVNEEPVGQQVISPKTAAQVRTMLESVVGPEGTASKAQVPGYRVGGKTGTAEKIVNGRYSRTDNIGYFVGIAPMSKPRFIIAVMIDNPRGALRTGGSVAAPTAADLAANALRAANIAPDSSVTDIIIPEEPLEESL